MMSAPIIDVIIPAFNEENAIGNVLREIPKHLVREVVVVDNNSSDSTQSAARAGGATVLEENIQGYGAACLRGIAHLKAKNEPPSIVVFIDADYSDFPEEMVQLVAPIVEGKADFVVGSRALGDRQRGSMSPQQVFGNWLATTLLRWIYRVNYSDLGPFRAINFKKLIALDMRDQTYGWTVEMQLKAAKLKLAYVEIPVKYRVRIGKSKISGTIKGSVLAGWKIITTIFKYA